MSRVAGDIVIDRPLEEVFDAVADERNEPRYNPRVRRVQLLTTGPVGPGSRFHAELDGRRRSVEVDVELTAYERPHFVASVSRSRWLDVRGIIRFAPVRGGTRLSWSWELEPHGLLGLVGPVATLVGQRREQATWAGLKRLLERRTGPGAVPEAPRGGERRRTLLALGGGLVMLSAVAGTWRLWTGGDDEELAGLRAQLPLHSTRLAAAALAGAVAAPYGTVTVLAWRGDRRTDAASLVAGSLLLTWLGTQRLVLTERSVLQGIYAGMAVPFVIAGARGLLTGDRPRFRQAPWLRQQRQRAQRQRAQRQRRQWQWRPRTRASAPGGRRAALPGRRVAA